MNRIRFEGLDYAPVADFGLLRAAYDAAAARAGDATVHVGLIFSSDSFYRPRPELTARMVEHGVLAVEMEASALYTLAAAARPPGAGDLHGLRPHRHRRGDHRRRSASRPSAPWSRSRWRRRSHRTEQYRARSRSLHSAWRSSTRS